MERRIILLKIYCLVDMEIFLDNLDKQLNDNENEAKIEVQSEVSEAIPENTVDNNTVLSYNVNKKNLLSNNSGNPDDFDVVFLIDCRSVSKDEEYAVIVRNVIETADTVFVKSPKARVRIIAMKSTAENPRYREVVRGDIMQCVGTETGSGYFYNVDEVYDALKFIKEHQKDVKGDCDVSSAIGRLYEINKYNPKQVYAFCVVQPEGSLQNVKDSNNVLKDIKEKGTIQINTVFLMEAKNENEFSYANKMINYTGGKAHFKYDDSSEFMLKQIYNNPEVNNGFRAIIGTGYRTVVFNSSLEQNYKWSNGKEKDKITEDDDLDKDGLYDYQEIMFKDSKENLLVKENSDGSIQLLKYEDIIGKVGEELFYVKNGLERYCSATGENANNSPKIESLLKCNILPIKSDPTNPDGDGDGLLDGAAQYVDGKVVVPRDYDPLKYNGPDNMVQFWKNQIDMQRMKEYQTSYGTDSKLDIEFEKFFSNIDFEKNLDFIWTFLYEVNKLDGDYPDQSDFLVKLFAKSPITNLIANTDFGTNWGASFLRFKRSADGKTLHARPDRDYKQWQYYLGYFNLYDSVFRRGTDALRKKVYYEYNGETYVLWCWKGDYMNLGLGSEFGIYRVVNDNEYELNNGMKFDEFTMVDINRTMTNSTYCYNENIANWQPEEKIWWATAFNPAYKNKTYADVENMLVLGTIDFSTTANDRAMYECFKNDVVNGSTLDKINKDNSLAKAKDQLIFDDDNHIVWLIWWGE